MEYIGTKEPTKLVKMELNPRIKANLILLITIAFPVLMGLACDSGGKGSVVKDDAGRPVQCEGGGVLGFLERLLEDDPYKGC